MHFCHFPNEMHSFSIMVSRCIMANTVESGGNTELRVEKVSVCCLFLTAAFPPPLPPYFCLHPTLGGCGGWGKQPTLSAAVTSRKPFSGFIILGFICIGINYNL